MMQYISNGTARFIGLCRLRIPRRRSVVQTVRWFVTTVYCYEGVALYSFEAAELLSVFGTNRYFFVQQIERMTPQIKMEIISTIQAGV